MSLSTVSRLLYLAMLFGSIQSRLSPLSFDLDYQPHALSRRDGISVDPFYSVPSFGVQITLGTPAQKVRLPITTYNSDILVVDPALVTCNSVSCGLGARFDSNTSATYNVHSEFVSHNGDGTKTMGDIASDNVGLAGQTFENANIVVAKDGNSTQHYLGLSFIEDEIGDQKYANLPALPLSQQRANLIGFSLFLPPVESTATARLMLGSIDTGKFLDVLETVSITKSSATGWTVPMSAVSVGVGSQNHIIDNSSLNVFPQPGEPDCWFPPWINRPLMSMLNATDNNGIYIYPIEQMYESTTIDITFGSTTIPIPISDISSELNSTHRSLLIKESTAEGVSFLGLPFFRHAYTVFDYSNKQFSLARSNVNQTADNVTLIAATGVAGLQGLPSRVDPSDPGPNSSRTHGGDDGASSSLSPGAKVGISIGVFVGVSLLMTPLVLLCVRYRKDKQPSGKGFTNTIVSGNKSELPNTSTRAELDIRNGSSRSELAAYGSTPRPPIHASLITPPPKELPTMADASPGTISFFI